MVWNIGITPHHGGQERGNGDSCFLFFFYSCCVLTPLLLTEIIKKNSSRWDNWVILGGSYAETDMIGIHSALRFEYIFNQGERSSAA